DVIINSLGGDIFVESFNHVAPGGKIATFGVVTGANILVNLAKIYTQEIQLMGTTGGTLSEMRSLLTMMQKHSIQLPTDRTYEMNQLKEAIQAYTGRSQGRILLKM
ncbi:alcohol dehydrogenase, partial [mine drainage metagenome]